METMTIGPHAKYCTTVEMCLEEQRLEPWGFPVLGKGGGEGYWCMLS